VPCGGYREPLESYFRDVTKEVIRKAKLKESKGQTTTTTTGPQKHLELLSSVSPSIVDIASQHFYETYLPDSHFDYLFHMMDELSSSKCFQTSTHAVALANLASKKNDNHLMHLSRSMYIKAIREVNVALKSNEVLKNSTLVSTLILGLFEAIIIKNDNWRPQNASVDDCFNSWIAHANGTMSLIMFRGKELLQTKFGRIAYYQAANKVRANCSQRHIRLSPRFVEMDKLAAPLLKGMSPLNRFPTFRYWPLIDMVIEMRARCEGNEIQTLSYVC
jgi:Fungal specific transcription factor domain